MFLEKKMKKVSKRKDSLNQEEDGLKQLSVKELIGRIEGKRQTEEREADCGLFEGTLMGPLRGPHLKTGDPSPQTGEESAPRVFRISEGKVGSLRRLYEDDMDISVKKERSFGRFFGMETDTPHIGLNTNIFGTSTKTTKGKKMFHGSSKESLVNEGLGKKI